MKSEGGSGGNWYAMENSREHVTRRKYYLNVCRPLNPVPGCDRYASACQMKYENNEVCLVFSLDSKAWCVKVVVLELLIRAACCPGEASCTDTYHIESVQT